MDSKVKVRKPNVLAVDDYAPNLMALEVTLNGEFHLIEANSGAQALSILRSRQDIDVILIDVELEETIKN